MNAKAKQIAQQIIAMSNSPKNIILLSIKLSCVLCLDMLFNCHRMNRVKANFTVLNQLCKNYNCNCLVRIPSIEDYLAPARNTIRDSLIPQLMAQFFQSGISTLPFQVAEFFFERNSSRRVVNFLS